MNNVNQEGIIKDGLSIEEPERINKIVDEFVEGFKVLSKIKKAVSIFGSSRLKANHYYYKKAYKISYRFSKKGYAIITGGGAGIMKAANKGAKEGGSQSIGLNIKIPPEQTPNKYIDTLLTFKYFFCRKVMFLKYTNACIFLPGGFGTMDEFFEIITLIQTNRINTIPIILIGKKFWKSLEKWIKDYMLEEKMISENDTNVFHITNSPKEAMNIIEVFYKSL